MFLKGQGCHASLINFACPQICFLVLVECDSNDGFLPLYLILLPPPSRPISHRLFSSFYSISNFYSQKSPSTATTATATTTASTMPNVVDFPSTTSSPADIFHITLPDNDDDDFANDSDESRALSSLKARLAHAGSLRVQEFFDAAALDLRRKLAAVPQNDKATREGVFSNFMANMRSVATIQAEEVEARVQMEKRERDGIKGFFATAPAAPITTSVSSSSSRPSGSGWGGDAIAGPSGSGNNNAAAGAHLSAGGSISATASVSEALYLEQLRLWEEAQVTKAMSPTSHHDDDVRTDRSSMGLGSASGMNGRPADVGASASGASFFEFTLTFAFQVV